MEFCFHYSDFEGQNKLLSILSSMVMCEEELVVLCIGTDRVSGDSLGPMVGTFLQEECRSAKVYGTLSSPVHAQNIEETIVKVQMEHPQAFVIAVDACLGKVANVEKIMFAKQPLKPGTGVNKELPEVGHVNIQGIVNVGGFMPQLVIQNTRMNTVYNMSRIIAGTLAQIVIAHKNFYPVFQLKEA